MHIEICLSATLSTMSKICAAVRRCGKSRYSLIAVVLCLSTLLVVYHTDRISAFVSYRLVIEAETSNLVLSPEKTVVAHQGDAGAEPEDLQPDDSNNDPKTLKPVIARPRPANKKVGIYKKVNFTDRSTPHLDKLLDQKAPHNSLKEFVDFRDTSRTLEDHCDSCAVVSASGALLGSSAGKDIDSHQCVFRMNHHISGNFSRDVGKRTTHRIIAHSSVGFCRPLNLHRTESNTTMLIWGPRQAVKKYGYGWNYALHLETMSNNSMKVYLMNDTRNTRYFDTVWGEEVGQDRRAFDVWLSTGFFSTVTALNLCDSVTTYGFIKTSDCELDKYRNMPYAYDQNSPKPTACREMDAHQKSPGFSHAFYTEHEMFNRVIAHSSVKNCRALDLHRTESNTTMLIWGPNKAVKRYSYGWNYSMLLETLSNNSMRVYLMNDSRNTLYFDTVWTEEVGGARDEFHVWLSTGFFSMVTALNLCDSVTAYGFMRTSDCRLDKYKAVSYAYDQKSRWPTACSAMNKHQNSPGFSHAFYTEHAIFDRWRKFRDITFKYPSRL